ncbi:MAG: hypothetical protein WB609_07510 [Candidatus Cybelea sp.]
MLQTLMVAAGWVALGIITFLAFAVLLNIYKGDIDLSALINSKDGDSKDASMSRNGSGPKKPEPAGEGVQ